MGILATVLAFAVMASLALSTCYAAFMLHRAAQFQAIRKSALQMNEKRVTPQGFIRLLDVASEEMVIYNDGDDVADSMYGTEEITQAIHRKLSSHPDFRVRCLFNCNASQLKFRREFDSADPRIEIRIRRSAEERTARAEAVPHYKMIDGGRCVYLSWHDRGSMTRAYQMIDCSKVKGFGRDRVIRKIVGKYADHFDHEFSNAIPVAAT